MGNLKQIKTNNEDYIVMQKISSQIDPNAFNFKGMNTTKNKTKSIDKTFKGGTSLGKSNYFHELQSSDESSLAQI